MATLSPEEERLISSWLMQKMPAAAETMVEKWWQGICQSVVRRRLETAKNRIKVPGLSAGEVLNLQKQILDLQEQLHESCPARRRRATHRWFQLPRGRAKVLDQILNRTNLARHSKRRGGSRQSSARRLKSSRRRSAPKKRLNSQRNHSKPPRLTGSEARAHQVFVKTRQPQWTSFDAGARSNGFVFVG